MGVTAYPPQTAPPGPITFQYRCRVAEGAALQGAFRCTVPQGLEQAVQLLPHDVVVVLPVSIPGDLQFMVRDGRGRAVVQGHADHCPASFHEEARVEPFGFMPFHVSHTGLPSFAEPTFEEGGVLRGDRSGWGQSASRKAEACGLGFYLSGRKYVFCFYHPFLHKSLTLGRHRTSSVYTHLIAFLSLDILTRDFLSP